VFGAACADFCAHSRPIILAARLFVGVGLGVAAFAMSSMALAQSLNGVHEMKKRLVESLNGKMPKHVMIAPTQKRVLILGPMLPPIASC